MSNADPLKKYINCPTCRKKTEYSLDNNYRPFCSDRCKLIDLGAWASENYTVSSPINPQNLALSSQEIDLLAESLEQE